MILNNLFTQGIFPVNNFRDNYSKFRSLQSHNHMIEVYNDLADSGNAYTAISILSQNRLELQRKTSELTEEIKPLIKEINEILSVETKKGSDLEYLSNTLMHFVGEVDESGMDLESGIMKEKVEYFIRRFCKESGKDYFINLVRRFQNLHEKKSTRINLLRKVDAIEKVTREVLTNNYPSSLEPNFDINNHEEKEDRGRPPKVDYETVKKRVEELVTKALNDEPGYKKYWHFEGTYEETPVKNQLRKTIINELPVEVDDSTVLRHIRKAVAELDL